MNEISTRTLCLIIIIAFAAIASVFWIQAGIEARVFNRCNPDAPITQWEALWTTTRIDGCEKAYDKT